MSVLGIDEPLQGFPDPAKADHVIHNPSRRRLRAFSDHLETPTAFGAPAYVSEAKSRSADRTKNAIDERFTPADWSVIKTGLDYVNNPDNDLICVDRQVGRHSAANFQCRLFVPREFGRIALAWMNLLEPATGSEPDFVTVQLPHLAKTKIRVLPESGITCILGSDYTGEAKKSFLRLFMYRIKQRGGLGLHAGSKRVTVFRDDEPTSIGQLFLGLSATGKTTLTCHDFGLSGPESAKMLQDDVCALLPDGTVAGSEGGGLYIKTIGLSPDEQPALHTAVTASDAVLENVTVGSNGEVDFDDDRYTSNTRAVVRRGHIDHATEEIDLETVDQVFFITRNPLMPPVARLEPAQAAAAFMLGESIQTSAGDPSQAGEAVRVVGTNPFIIGPEGKEGNRFYELLEQLDVESFILNTGEVGSNGRDIGVEETVSILRAVARDQIDWVMDEQLGMRIPEAVPGVKIDAYYPPTIVEDFGSKYHRLYKDRREYLAQFDSLDNAIKEAVY